MVKPMLVTLPFVMLLLDFWPLRRVQLVTRKLQPETTTLQNSYTPILQLILEKLPFFALTIASCVATFIAQKGGGAVVPLKVLPFSERLANAIVATTVYLAKMVWPPKLSILYPLRTDVPPVAVVASVVILLLSPLPFIMRLPSKTAKPDPEALGGH